MQDIFKKSILYIFFKILYIIINYFNNECTHVIFQQKSNCFYALYVCELPVIFVTKIH